MIRACLVWAVLTSTWATHWRAEGKPGSGGPIAFWQMAAEPNAGKCSSTDLARRIWTSRLHSLPVVSPIAWCVEMWMHHARALQLALTGYARARRRLAVLQPLRPVQWHGLPPANRSSYDPSAHPGQHLRSAEYTSSKEVPHTVGRSVPEVGIAPSRPVQILLRSVLAYRVFGQTSRDARSPRHLGGYIATEFSRRCDPGRLFD